MVKHIEVTEAMRDALAAIDRAEAVYVPGFDSSSVIEIPKLALANAVLAAVRRQQATRVSRLPERAPVVPVIEVTIRPKRRRA